MSEQAIIDRFWARVDKRSPGECWEWRGGRTTAGYGSISINGRHFYTHRLAYELTYGDIGDLKVLHRCDNPPCCNPAHLFKGTMADNTRDMIAKGRVARAEKIPSTKMTWPQVRAAREMYRVGDVSADRLGSVFGVSRQTMQSILRNETWKDSGYEYHVAPTPKKGERNAHSKLSWQEVREIRTRRGKGQLLRQIAKDFGVSAQTISRIANGNAWIAPPAFVDATLAACADPAMVEKSPRVAAVVSECGRT